MYPAMKKYLLIFTLLSTPAFADLAQGDPNNAAFSNKIVITVGGQYVAPGRSVGVNCTSAGNVTFTMQSGTTITVPVVPGWQTFPFAVTGVTVFTGTGEIDNLY